MIVSVQDKQNRDHLIQYTKYGYANEALCGFEQGGPWVLNRPAPSNPCEDCYNGGST